MAAHTAMILAREIWWGDGLLCFAGSRETFFDAAAAPMLWKVAPTLGVALSPPLKSHRGGCQLLLVAWWKIINAAMNRQLCYNGAAGFCCLVGLWRIILGYGAPPGSMENLITTARDTMCSLV
jgi:hypothetical protein